MSAKDLYNNGTSFGKSLYNLQPKGEVTGSALGGFLNKFISSGEASTDSGSQDFGTVTADILNASYISSLNSISVGAGGLLKIVPLDQQRINDAFTFGVMVTTNMYNQQADLATGYTSIKLDVPYVYNIPDHVLIATNKEAPDNFLEVANSKFKVTGPFTMIKSTKVSFKSPNITLGYYDREESSFENASTLDFKTYDKGIVMERVEDNSKVESAIKKSFMGYSQNFGRFVMYKDAVYTGTERYGYPKINGLPGDILGTLTEYQIDRNPDTLGVIDGNSALEVDTIYTNRIIASDHTDSRSLILKSYDTMTIDVERALGDTDMSKNFDLLLNVAGKIIVSSGGSGGAIQTSADDYIIRSDTGTFINAYNPDNPLYGGVPVYIGCGSTVTIDDYLKTTYLSAGNVTSRNTDTLVEIGGDFTAVGGIGAGSKLLIDGTITGETNNDIHGIYSNLIMDVPDFNNVNYVSNTTLQPLTLNIGTGSAVDTSSTLHVVGATSNATNNYAILTSQGENRFVGSNTGIYCSWSNDSLNLMNSRLVVNAETSTAPVITFGNPNYQTNFYELKRLNVDGTIMASFEIKYSLTICNGIKSTQSFVLNKLCGAVDSNDLEIFDVSVGYSGHDTNFVTGDGLTITGINTNSTNTNWFVIIQVSRIAKP